jgi:hypothetical protein
LSLDQGAWIGDTLENVLAADEELARNIHKEDERPYFDQRATEPSREPYLAFLQLARADQAGSRSKSGGQRGRRAQTAVPSVARRALDQIQRAAVSGESVEWSGAGGRAVRRLEDLPPYEKSWDSEQYRIVDNAETDGPDTIMEEERDIYHEMMELGMDVEPMEEEHEGLSGSERQASGNVPGWPVGTWQEPRPKVMEGAYQEQKNQEKYSRQLPEHIYNRGLTKIDNPRWDATKGKRPQTTTGSRPMGSVPNFKWREKLTLPNEKKEGKFKAGDLASNRSQNVF